MRRLIWLAPALAFWSVWLDYAQRIALDAQASVHVAAVACGLWVLWEPRATASKTRAASWIAIAGTLAYAATYAQLTAMPRCLLALASLAAFTAWQRDSARPWLGASLVLLGVPALGQIEQLLGGQVRLSVAEAAAALIRVQGMAIEAEGTRLTWLGRVVDVDAPCSGLRMLWTGAFVALLALAHFRLHASRVGALALGAVTMIWGGNVLRCTALFYVESGILLAPAWVHPAVGATVFAIVCAALWEGARWLSTSGAPCES